MTGPSLSRRRLLAGVGAAGAGVAGAALAAATVVGDGPNGDRDTVPFEGPHQAGIATAVPAHLHFAAFDGAG